jgi:hypothetical protein
MKTIILSFVMSVLAPLGCGPTQPTITAKPSAETWAFCGVNPTDIYAQKKANTMASVAGIDATFGPCLPPDMSTYTPAFPGQRYLSPQDYFALTVINANAGMKTIVYDARIWSDDSAIRQQAMDFWAPHIRWIRAWDMGDEFDPDTSDWTLLVHRWRIVNTYITPVMGVGPFTNHLGSTTVLDRALQDMPEQRNHYSFDAYTEDVYGNPVALIEMAAYAAPQVNHLMCAVNGMTHFQFTQNAKKLEKQMDTAIQVGCKSFLIFGGDKPVNTPGFESPSLVNWNGSPTSLAWAVAKGAS